MKPKFKKGKKKTDKPKAESIHSGTNRNPGPENRADSALKHMMSHKPMGFKQSDRRKK